MRKRTSLLGLVGFVGFVGLVGFGGLLSCDRFLTRNPEYCASNADCADKGSGREVCNLTLNSCGSSSGPVTLVRLDPAVSSSTDGVRVSVIGQGFQPGMRALVMGSPVETEFRSATELSFLMPPGKACSQIQVSFQSADGTPITGSLPFRYKVKQPTFALVPQNGWAMVAKGVGAADLNNDGVSEIYYVNQNNPGLNQLDIYTKSGAGYSGSAFGLQGPYDGVRLVEAREATGSNFVFWRTDGFALSKVTGGAPPPGPFVGVSTLGGLAVAPLNAGDPSNDLVVIENSMLTGQLLIYLNNGTTSFARQTARPALAGPGKGLAVGDFNSDGKADIVVALEQNVGIQLFRGNGDGSFLAGVEHRTNLPPSVIAAADA